MLSEVPPGANSLQVVVTCILFPFITHPLISLMSLYIAIAQDSTGMVRMMSRPCLLGILKSRPPLHGHMVMPLATLSSLPTTALAAYVNRTSVRHWYANKKSDLLACDFSLSPTNFFAPIV